MQSNDWKEFSPNGYWTYFTKSLSWQKQLVTALSDRMPSESPLLMAYSPFRYVDLSPTPVERLYEVDIDALRDAVPTVLYIVLKYKNITADEICFDYSEPLEKQYHAIYCLIQHPTSKASSEGTVYHELEKTDKDECYADIQEYLLSVALKESNGKA